MTKWYENVFKVDVAKKPWTSKIETRWWKCASLEKAKQATHQEGSNKQEGEQEAQDCKTQAASRIIFNAKQQQQY